MRRFTLLTIIAPLCAMQAPDVATMTTRELAERTLPPADAATVVSHTFREPSLSGGPPAGIRFATRVRTIEPGICSREVLIAPMPGHDSLPVRYRDWAFAKDCNSPIARFAQQQPSASAESPVMALRALKKARHEAEGTHILRGKVTCAPVERCGKGPRQTLAAMRLDRMFMLHSVPDATASISNAWLVTVATGTAGTPVWNTTVRGSTIAMQWIVAPPF